MEDPEDFFLSESQVLKLLKLVRVGKRDTFYDLGCGDGLAVCMAVSHGHAKRAIGVESDRGNFEEACRLAVDRLRKGELKKVNFWFGDFRNEDSDGYGGHMYDYSDATVVYHSLEEMEEDVAFYKHRLDKKVRIVRKDLPLVGYEPISVNREDPDCWFFLHRFPLKRVRSKDSWARLVLGRDEASIDDVLAYVRDQLESRNTIEGDIRSSLRELKKLVCFRFWN